MPKKIILTGIVAIALFVLSYVFYSTVVIDHNASKFASIFETHIHKQEQEVRSILKNKMFFSDILHAQSDTKYNHLNKLEELSKKSYQISLFKGDSIIFWSNNKAEIKKEDVNKTPTIIYLKNGIYQTVSKKMKLKGIGNVKAIALIPIEYNYPVKNKYENNEFAINIPFPTNIELSKTKTPYEIKSISGKHLCYFTSNGLIVNPNMLYLSFIFFLIALVLNIYSVNQITVYFNTKNFKLATAYLLLSIFVMIAIFLIFDFEEKFSSFSIFQSIAINPNIYLSYVAIILYLSLGIWLLLFVLKNYQTNHQIKRKNIFILNAALLAVAIIMTVFLTMDGFKSLIHNTNQAFNFSESIQFAVENPIGLITIVLMTLVQFIVSIVLMNMIKKFEQKQVVRLGIYALSLISVLLLNNITGLEIPKLLLIPYIIILLLVLDLFIIGKNKNLLKSIWLLGLPALTTAMLVTFYSTKEYNQKREYAILLADRSDVIAEEELFNLKEKIKKSPTFLSPLYKSNNMKSLKEEMKRIFSKSGYLEDYYNFELFVYNKNGESLTNSNSPQQTLINVFNKAIKTDFDDVKLYTDKFKTSYVVRLMAGTPVQPKEVFVQLVKSKNIVKNIYPDVFIQKQFKGIKHLDKYPYAIYNSKGLVYRSNNSFSQNYSFKTPAPNSFIEQSLQDDKVTIYQNNSQITVVLKHTPIDTWGIVSLFSVLYIMVLLLIIIIGSFNTYYSFLPPELHINFKSESLKQYLYQNILLLIATSIFIVGGVTWVFFGNSTVSYNGQRLTRKTQSVVESTENQMTLLTKKNRFVDDLESDYLEYKGDEILSFLNLQSISKANRLEVNLYDLSGKLVKSSAQGVFEQGIISKQMDFPAYFSLAKMNQDEYIDNNGQIGNSKYKISYNPIVLKQGTKQLKVGYVGFPYYSKKSTSVYDFMGKLISVYVFLFIFGSIRASKLATTITNPIESLAGKLRKFRLGGTNEEIFSKRNDEVGALINEYNKLIIKVDEGTKNFKALEKEKAFRQMARSVAHDIKNPLTPMKLHIQFLELSINSDIDEFKNRVLKTSKTLLDQIAHIESIVSALNVVELKTEFQKLSLSKLIESAYQLYKLKKDITINLFLPDCHYYINADENQISRVLNNLITNANQALDEFGERLIEIYITEKNKYVVVEIKDTGCGIAEDMYDKILEHNFTTKSTGSGLGLSMVRTIVEDSNGRIYFESKVGVGTSFFIEFPIIDTEAHRFGYNQKPLGLS